MQKVVVTGGAGFIGSHLVDALVSKYDVVVLDNLSTGKKSYINKKAKFYKVDVKDYKALRKHFKGAKYVFHLAAQARVQPSIVDPSKCFDNNVLGTFNVLLAARDEKVKRVIYSASSSAYGDENKVPFREDMHTYPKNPYALFKLMGEDMCKMFYSLYDLETVCLRYFNVYGDRQPTTGAYATVIGIFMDQKKKKQPLTVVGTGRQRRDFTHVSDVVQANILAIDSVDAPGETINIGTGKNYSVIQVAKMISKDIKFIPQRLGEMKETLADISWAKKVLHWSPKVELKEWLKNV